MDEQKPGPLEWSIGSSLGVAAVLTAVYVHKLLITLILLGLLLLLIGGYLLWRWWQRGHSEQKFSSDMEQQGGNASVRKAEQKAQLDQLRKAFKEGTDVYKKRRKDIYSVPWYLMIGTPGSGKTEAIRHSEIGFPPGLTDPLAGVGGTINMNWWFTNYGVILDTAGKMVFPESTGAGQSQEWDEFLRLLRKHRQACPINGLFLALDVDKMIKDSGEAISKKASQVAQQLDRIQRSLDVRFPVYLLVTKSDFLTGFKEYFEGIDDPQLQNQILGWSNQAPLDDPVDPDAIEGHLRELVEVVKRRRLAVIRAPVNLDLHQNRRLDCTDAMFAFPESLERLIPRLKRYLQIIFSAGEFSAKPVFLRGIYFTSSMQQNGDLDEALAEFLGIQVTQLPPANVQETAKSYFLRDLFIEKSFKERLVTSASNTRRMRRNRLLILSGLTALTVGALVLFALLGSREYNKHVGQELAAWQEAAKDWQDVPHVPGGFWRPIVTQSNNNEWRYTGDDRPFTSSDLKNSSLANFHLMLKNMVSGSNSGPWIFRPLELAHGADVKGAQKALVEHSVLLPLLEAAGSKMSAMKAQALMDTAATIRLRKALECLVQTQADIDGKPLHLSEPDVEQKLGSFIKALLQFVLNTDTPVGVDSNLVAACAWTYARGGAVGDWPPQSLARGTTTLASYPPANDGLDCLIAQVGRSQQEVEDDLASLTAVFSNLSTVERVENTLRDDAIPNCALTPEDFAAWQTAAKELQTSLNQLLQRHLAETTASAGVLETAVSKIKLKDSAASSEAYKSILVAADSGIQTAKRPSFFGEIKTRCQQSSGTVQSKVTAALADYQRSLSNWDSNFLAGAESGGKSYFEQRNEIYQGALAVRNPTTVGQVGTLRKTLTYWQARLDKVREEISKYNGPLKVQCKQVCDCAIQDSEKLGKVGILSNYCAQIELKLLDYRRASTVSFPELTEEYAFFTNLDTDLTLESSLDIPPLGLDELHDLRVQYKEPIRNAVINAYTNWLVTQLSGPEDGQGHNDPFEAYRNFRDLRDNYLTNELNCPVVQYFPKPQIDQIKQWAAAEAGKRLDKYARSCGEILRQKAAFPVILSSSDEMTRDQVLQLKEELKKRTSEFKEVQGKDSDQSQAFATLKENVNLLLQVVSALAPDAEPRFTSKMASHYKSEDADNQCPFLHLTNSTGGQYFRLDLTKQGSEVLPDLADPLDIKVTGYVDFIDPRETTPFYKHHWDRWGALHLIKLDHVEFEGGNWIVPIPVQYGDPGNKTKGTVHVELILPPLPPLERWKNLNLTPP